MAKKQIISCNIVMAGNEVQEVSMEKLSSPPSSPVEGQFYYNSAVKKPYQWNGTAWQPMGDGSYVLPAATASSLGGVMAGDNVNISSTGTISVKDATNAQKGLIQIATDTEATTGTDEAKATNSKQVKAAADAAKTAAITDIESKKGAASGFASLGADSKIPSSQLPDFLLGQMILGGEFDASGVATITSGLQSRLGLASTETTIQLINSATDDTTTTPKQYGYQTLEGAYFLASADCTIGSTKFDIGDWLVAFGTKWGKIDNTDAVSSVAGKTGVVTLVKGDVGLGNVDNTSDADKPVSTATQTALNDKLTTPTGGTVGQVIMKTATGSAWKDAAITKVLTMDFRDYEETAVIPNVLGDMHIKAVAAYNISTIKLSHGTTIQQVITPGTVDIAILADETMIWEIGRATDGQPAALSVKYIEDTYLI